MSSVPKKADKLNLSLQNVYVLYMKYRKPQDYGYGKGQYKTQSPPIICQDTHKLGENGKRRILKFSLDNVTQIL